MTMRNPLAVPITISVCLLITGATFAISGRNVAPDAVTRATTWNSHVGEFSTLSDGQIPSTDSAAPPFIWETKGILVFEWSEPVFLDSMRIYVGDVGNNYQVRAYLGGRLDETGTLREPEGQQTALLNIDDRGGFLRRRHPGRQHRIVVTWTDCVLRGGDTRPGE